MKKSDNQTYDQQKLPRLYGLTCISPSTVCRWLKVLGFKYEVQKKVTMLMIMKRKVQWNTNGNMLIVSSREKPKCIAGYK